MKTYLFVDKVDETKRVTIKTDQIDGKESRFTIMTIDGLKNTDFEKVMPWKPGDVLDSTVFQSFATDNAETINVYEISDSEKKQLGIDDMYNLNITIIASVEGYESTFSMKIVGKKADSPDHEIDISDAASGSITERVYNGYSYSFELLGSASWSSGTTPDAVEIDGNDADVILEITIY